MQADRLTPLSDAIAAGRGLPHALRAAARTLDASLMVSDDAGATLAVAARSPADERMLVTGGATVVTHKLRRGGRTLGRLHLRRPGRADPPPPALVRLVRTLLAAEVERRGARERATLAEETAVVRSLIGGERQHLVRAEELLGGGAAVVHVRARRAGRRAEPLDARLLLLVRRAVRRSLAAVLDPSADGEVQVAVIVPARGAAAIRRAAETIGRELTRSEPGIRLALGYSRRTRPADLRRAARQAALAARVAATRAPGATVAFEDTGAYRLLLAFPRTGASELRQFYRDTVEPLAAYDAAHGTSLVETLEAFLECDTSHARTAERLFTHRHTVRYRLARIRELTGLDVGSTPGREQLGLGLKAMRLLAAEREPDSAAA